MEQAAITGATGLVGSACLDLLLESRQFDKVISLTRRASGRTHPKLVENVVSFDGLPELAEIGSLSALFCALGTTIGKAGSQDAFRKVDLDYVLSFARWGLKHGARHFLVVSSMGADPGSRIFYSRTKGQMETEVGKLGYAAVDIFRPSLLLGPREELRTGEKIGALVSSVIGPLLIGRLRDYRAIPAQTVAKAMVAAALAPKPGVHRHLSGDIGKSGAI